MDVFDDLSDSFLRLTAALDQLEAAMIEAKENVDALAYFLLTPQYRRAMLEMKLVRKLPDWVWRVEEQQRRQFGSGNGREIRE